jgi:hypothetical protein
MTVSIFDTHRIFPAARFVLLAGATLLLAACQTDSSGLAAADAPRAEAASPRPDAAANLQTAGPAAPTEDLEPMTRTRAARECWMKTEKSGPRENLDKRADLVNRCIDDKMKAAGMAAPKT